MGQRDAKDLDAPIERGEWSIAVSCIAEPARLHILRTRRLGGAGQIVIDAAGIDPCWCVHFATTCNPHCDERRDR